VAPAGSGKTTTLVARIAWLVATGVAPEEITAVTFNRRAAVELSERLESALDWLAPRTEDAAGPAAAADRGAEGRHAGKVRVRTFHALGLEILRSTGRQLPELIDRATMLGSVTPEAGRAELARLDGAFSRLKLDMDVTAAEVAEDPEAGPIARAFVRYEAALEARGAMDFDDLVRHALRALEADPALLGRWRRRCAHLLVDETQDVDRSQLRLALLLAAPANRIFLVGDDDQSIYGWRLADVRRVLGLANELPGLRRIDLEVNYRCPATVLERAVRLVEHNQERFAKAIRAGPASTGVLVLAPEPPDDELRAGRILDHWADRPGTRAILARTNRELAPAAAVALARGMPFRASGSQLLLEDPALSDVLAAIRSGTSASWPLLVRIGYVRDELVAPEHGIAEPPSQRGPAGAPPDAASDELPEPPAMVELANALLGWAVRYPDLEALEAAVIGARQRLAELRRDDAPLTLATAHSTKGLEFDHVAVIGMDDGRFPSARSLADSEDPGRALEEERRLGYVAWTRARRSLVLVYDPKAPSRFLRETFSPDELGLQEMVRPGRSPPGPTISGMSRQGSHP
jgi:superfamily I DNA/RNA helicase